MDFQTSITYLKRILDNPQRLLRILSSPCARGLLINSFNEPTSYDFVNFITKISKKDYLKYSAEIEDDQQFFTYLHNKHQEIRGKQLPQPQGWTELIYILIRKIKPNIVVETGVFDGISSAFILNALDKNRKGKLISVDLPAKKVIQGSTDLMPFTTLPKTQSPGWLVPNYLRKRWDLRLIDQQLGLKNILKNIDGIDIFLHDSLHTKQHMLWESELAWNKIKKGGIILIDDIFCNCALNEFAKKLKKKTIIKYGLGAIKKARP